MFMTPAATATTGTMAPAMNHCDETSVLPLHAKDHVAAGVVANSDQHHAVSVQQLNEAAQELARNLGFNFPGLYDGRLPRGHV